MRAKSLARQVGIFGTGSFAGVYAIGPHRGLLGRAVSTLTVRPSSSLGVELDGRSLLDSVDPSGEFVPTYVAGSVTGTTARLDLAVALNGTVRAVTETFRQDGETRFAAFVPESSLRAGRNSVDVFVVRGSALERLRGGDLGLTLRSGAIASADGTSTRLDSHAVSGSVRVTATAHGFAFSGSAARKGGAVVDSVLVFVDGKGVYSGRARDLRPLEFLGEARAANRFRFELPQAVLPAAGDDHRVRVFAAAGDTAAELRYVGAYPWRH
jgi:hypothetical protein